MFATRAVMSGAASVFKQQLGVPKKKLLQLLQAALLLALAAVTAAAVWRITRIGAEFKNNVVIDNNNNNDNINNNNVNEAIVDRDFDGGDLAVDFKDPTTKRSVGANEKNEDRFGWDFDVSVKRDWHDYDAISKDKSRTGPGEEGKAHVISGEQLKSSTQRKLSQKHAYNAFASEEISIERSVKDIRHPLCQQKQYSINLPTVSVIIPFINEHPHTLKRTIFSVVNRSPPELLEEIILVDDFSADDELKQPLEDYLSSHPTLSTLVRIVRLEKREGLIVARQTGASKAKGMVLIFLDSHTEANYNWLPPLLEPIAADYRTAVCPFIDVIDMENFEYRAQDEGKRGSFDWEMYYKRLDLLPEDLKHPTRPFKSPVMAGGLFAISSQFFWELGGYDEGLKIWGGEQYELSFKIWQCGGQMLDAPCSRVGHIYRKFAPFGSGGVGNYLGKNLKRVAEVWMDEYKEYIYKRRPNYRELDAGDLSSQKALRERLQCKSFKWFMEEVAFDQPLNYPPVEPEDYANGPVSSVAYSNKCVNSSPSGKYYLAKCNEMLNQYFVMDWHKDIRGKTRSDCWDVSQGGFHAPIQPFSCHGGKGNQLWRYDLDHQWLVHGAPNSGHGGRCLDTDGDRDLFVAECKEDKMSQKWKFKNINSDRVRGWNLDKV